MPDENDTEKTHRWVRARAGLLAQRQLSGNDKVVLLVLLRLCWQGKVLEHSRPKTLETETVAAAAGLSERTVRAIIPRLVAWGLVTREREGRQRARYRLTDPDSVRFWKKGEVVQLTREQSAAITARAREEAGQLDALAEDLATLPVHEDEKTGQPNAANSAAQTGKVCQVDVAASSAQTGKVCHLDGDPDSPSEQGTQGCSTAISDPVSSPYRSPTECLAAGGPSSGARSAHPSRSSGPPAERAEDSGGLRPPSPRAAAAGLVRVEPVVQEDNDDMKDFNEMLFALKDEGDDGEDIRKAEDDQEALVAKDSNNDSLAESEDNLIASRKREPLVANASEDNLVAEEIHEGRRDPVREDTVEAAPTSSTPRGAQADQHPPRPPARPETPPEGGAVPGRRSDPPDADPLKRDDLELTWLSGDVVGRAGRHVLRVAAVRTEGDDGTTPPVWVLHVHRRDRGPGSGSITVGGYPAVPMSVFAKAVRDLVQERPAVRDLQGSDQVTALLVLATSQVAERYQERADDSRARVTAPGVGLLQHVAEDIMQRAGTPDWYGQLVDLLQQRDGRGDNAQRRKNWWRARARDVLALLVAQAVEQGDLGDLSAQVAWAELQARRKKNKTSNDQSTEGEQHHAQGQS